MRGDLRQSSLAEVVRHLYAERRSGILHVSRQNIGRRIHFKKGVAIFADTGDNQLQSREQAELLAYSLFTWTSGEFAFEDGEPNITESLAFEGSPSNIILEGIRRIDEVEILERLIGGRGSVFACTQTSVLPLFKMRLSPAENAILTFARDREQFTAEELPLPSEDLPVVNALNALLAVGLLEIVNKPPPEPVPDPLPVLEAVSAPPPSAAPIPVAPAPPPPPLPPPVAVAPPPAPVAPAPPVPVAPTPPPPAPVAPAPSPPAPMPAAAPAPEPAPQIAPIMPTVPSEMEKLFDTLESKRSRITRPNPVAPPPEAPIIEAAIATPEPPVAVAAVPEALQAAPPIVQAPAPAPPIVEAAPRVYEPPVYEAPAPPPPPAAFQPPPMQYAAAPPSTPRPSLMAVVSGWKDFVVELLPEGKARLLAGISITLMGAVVTLVVMLVSGNDDTTQPDAVAAANSTPSIEVSTPVQPPPTPTLEPEAEPEPAPSEAELFYRANLAFESGDFEQSQAELRRLLELKPDLAAARELMARVERALAPEPEAPKPKPAPRRVVTPPPPPKPEPQPEIVKPTGPTPSQLYVDARAALNRGELEASQAMLNELKSLNASYPGAQQLQEDLSDQFWQKTLPLAFSARHDHALGGCDGVLTLTSRGFGYRSGDHDWFWSFNQVATTERKDSRQLRLETTKGQSYNFELRDALTTGNWTRYQKLSSR